MSYQPIQFTQGQIDQFHQQGYLTLDSLIPADLVERIIERFDPLFNTEFETGIYPDEWYGRPGLSQVNATRHMVGLWRCDRTVASLSLSAEIARLNSNLMGWSGGRYGLDSCWIKPPNAPEVYFHRSNTYLSCLQPSSGVTCWIALSNIAKHTGMLEIVPGSHTWKCSDKVRFLHAPREDYRLPLWQAAAEAGVGEPKIMQVELSPGGCVFLHGDLWHGSGRNTTNKTRQAFAVTTLPIQTRFLPQGEGAGYIFSRYRRIGAMEMDESYFPILWTKDGYRSPVVEAYTLDALRVEAQLVG